MVILELMAESSTESARGAPVDSRLLQANERTLLAWLRTALGLIAFGFVLERVDGWLCGVAPTAGAVARPVGTAWIGAGFIVLGFLANALAVLRFARARRALRMGVPLPRDLLPVAFAGALTFLGATLAIYIIAKLV
jgi:putative membrane protein